MVLSLSAAAQTNAPNQWTWVGGLSTGAASAVYGTLGTPDPGNIPPARDGAVSWTDSSGNFWLFGGNISGIFTDTEHLWGGSFSRSELNDLWKFNPSTKEWAWMGGNGTANQPGVYGTLGTSSTGNIPGGRDSAVSWTDSSGNLWLFGGEGFDASGAFGVLNDLWEFNLSTKDWAWMGGSSTFGSSCFTYDTYPGDTNCAQPGVYGTLGTPAAGNIPGSRLGASGWADSKGNLWLFGGWGYDMNFDLQYFFNDLWEFNTSTKEWAWMGGTSTGSGSACFWNVNLWYDSCGEPGVYGTLGTSAAANSPGARNAANSWIDSNGNFWLFGGQGFDSNGLFSDLNDLWEFNPSTKEWAWMNGSSTIYDDVSQQRGVYGTLGTPAAANTPATRWGSASWTDSKGNLWLFGGQQSGDFGDGNSGTLDDLWEFNPLTNEWAWMGGSNMGWPPLDGVYGTLGTPAPGNNPGDRYAASSWTDSSGNFWFFGGQLPLGYLSLFANDLWEYQPSNGPLPTAATPTFNPPAGTYNGNQLVTLNDSTNGATIYYTTDGTAPTTSSPVYYNTPITVAYSQTIQAFATASGCLSSAVATAIYTLPPQVATPTFSVPAGTYTSTQTMTISDATPGATIYYTTNGTTPTTNSLVYSGPFTVSGSEWLKAFAVASGHSDSFVASALYDLNLPQVATPIFSLAGGRYNTPQTVTISDATPGATIYYSTTGVFPATNWPVYTGPITVSSSETIWAIAMAYNYDQSYSTEATFTINPNLPQAATPTFSVAGGTYTTPQTVTISDATPGATIYYTTDGSMPTASSTQYYTPITVSNSETLQAIAVADTYAYSSIANAAFTMNVPQDFSISTSPASLSMNAGQSGMATISITPVNGFHSTISFACSGLSSGTSCSFSPATVTPSGAAVTTTLTVTTSTATAAFRRTSNSLFSGSALTIALCFFGWKKRRRFQTLLLLSLSVASLSLFNGCGGGGSSGTLQSGSSTVTVIATSGSLQRSTTLSLTMN